MTAQLNSTGAVAPGPLNSIFSAVNTLLGGLIPQVTFGVSGPELSEGDSYPRIVWVPVRDTYAPAEDHGGDGIDNPKPLRTRMCVVQAHIWGADQDTVEAYLNLVASSIYDTVGPSNFDPVSGEWLAIETTEKAGAAYLLEFTLKVPLTHIPYQTAIIQSLPITPAVVPYAGQQ